MWFKGILFNVQYHIFYTIILQNFVSAKPLYGQNVRPAGENEFPFVAGIIRRSAIFLPHRDSVCTASLISPKDVLTAEHCMEDEFLNGIAVIVGSINLSSDSKYYPSWWINYDPWASGRDYDNGFASNDISIIRLIRSVADGLYPGELSFLPYNQMIGRQVTVMGWGELRNGSIPRILHTSEFNVINTSDCEARIYAVGHEVLTLDYNFICTVGVPNGLMMSGESGGPVLYENKIVAINTAACPLPELDYHPGKVNLHTNLLFYEEFISSALQIVF